MNVKRKAMSSLFLVVMKLNHGSRSVKSHNVTLGKMYRNKMSQDRLSHYLSPRKPIHQNGPIHNEYHQNHHNKHQ